MNGENKLEGLGKILIYQTEKGDTKIEVYFQDENIWMSQRNIAELYQTTPQNITLHMKNIFADGELDETSTCKDFLQVQKEEIKILRYTNTILLPFHSVRLERQKSDFSFRS